MFVKDADKRINSFASHCTFCFWKTRLMLCAIDLYVRSFLDTKSSWRSRKANLKDNKRNFSKSCNATEKTLPRNKLNEKPKCRPVCKKIIRSIRWRSNRKLRISVDSIDFFESTWNFRARSRLWSSNTRTRRRLSKKRWRLSGKLGWSITRENRTYELNKPRVR